MSIELPNELQLVFDVESEPPRLLGEYVGADENVVIYQDHRQGMGDVPRRAPDDCVQVVTFVRQTPRPASLSVVAIASAWGEDALELLRAQSTPIPDRDGWRRDAMGREWYSAAWLGLKS